MCLAICDDNEMERRILHSLLKKYFSEASISCEFTLYDRGTTLYYDIMDGMEFDIRSVAQRTAQEHRENASRSRVVVHL